jgi:hypothetical protein
MIRRSDILTGAALAMCCSLMLVAAASADAPPPSSIAASQAEEYEELRSEGAGGPSQDLRPPDVKDAAEGRGPYANDQGPYVLNREYGSPDAVDAARDLPPATVTASPVHAGPGPFTDSERKLVESPEVQAMVDGVSSDIRATPSVVEVEAPSGFDWGDAGIGAAGMLALFSIAAGSLLLIAGRRRRDDVRVATH